MKRLTLLAFCLLAAIAASAQTPPAPTAAKKVTNGFGPKSKEEQKAGQAGLSGTNPDEKIKAADALITGFPKTDYRGFALELEADAYQQKGDNTKAVVYGEQALE